MLLPCTLLFLAFGDGLRQQVIMEIEAGQSDRSNVQIALIAEGLTSAEEVADYAERYRERYERIAAKPAKGKGRKLAKSIQKNMLGDLDSPGDDHIGFRALIDDGRYTPLTASFLYVNLATAQGVSADDFALNAYLAPYLKEGGKPEASAILAAHLVQFALQRSDEEAVAIGEILQISSLLAPEATYGTDNADKLLYLRALELFNQKQYEPAAHLAVGGASRWPRLDAWPSMCYNLGVNLLRADPSRANDALVQRLQHHMGEFRQRFSTALDSQAYNRAARLYNQKKYGEALAILERIVQSNSPPDFKKVLADTYVRLLEDGGGDERENERMIAKLAALDTTKADYVRQRQAQLQLAQQVESGNLDEAYAEAAKHLDTDLDRRNFEAVLVQLNQKQRKDWSFQEALTMLADVPAEAQVNDVVDRLRFNTYADWLATFDDANYKGLVRVYERLFADPALKMSDQDRAAMTHNYGNALHQEITALIEERSFQKAEAKSKLALEKVPGHPPLLEQRKLVETIMKRVSK